MDHYFKRLHHLEPVQKGLDFIDELSWRRAFLNLAQNAQAPDPGTGNAHAQSNSEVFAHDSGFPRLWE